MPGAPNRPPEVAGPPKPPAEVPPERRVIRRLVPGRVALQLDIWKGAPSRDLLDPLVRAEERLDAGDFREAESALDRLAVRLAEPRWPTLPLPFRGLRVKIVQPQPPQYDPENALPPAERDALKARRDAELQLALAEASLAWAKGRGIDVADLLPSIGTSAEALKREGSSETFWAGIDLVWTGLRGRLPPPSPPVARVAPKPAEAVPESGASAAEP